MEQAMTASVKEGMTDGQIDNVVGKLRDALRKHRCEFPSNVAQSVLSTSNLGMALLAPFRELVEAMNDIITRHVSVNRSRSPQEMLDATGRKQYTDRKVVAGMQRGEGAEADVYFFKLGRYVSDADLDKEYELRGLKPADPYSLAAVNEADPAFADDHPNGTHWKDANGNWCCACFGRWGGGRKLDVYRDDDDWNDDWFFAGLRK